MNKTTLRRNLKKAYDEFFRKMDIDADTGCLDLDPKRKFATYPYVGSKYGTTKKILFVGLDISKDPIYGCIQSFPDRRSSIEDKSLSIHNRHIAGTYMATLYFLEQEKGWSSHWEKITTTNRTCQGVLKKHYDLLPLENPLSYCALTNYYKFVTKGRKKRKGSEDQVHLNREVERRLLDAELKAFGPDIVIFQGAGFKQKISNLEKRGTRFFVGPHPSAWADDFPGIHYPDGYVGHIEPIA